MEVTSIVLAGGKNLRLGRSKALEVINGRSLIERVMERLAPAASKLLTFFNINHQSDLEQAIKLVEERE